MSTITATTLKVSRLATVAQAHADILVKRAERLKDYAWRISTKKRSAAQNCWYEQHLWAWKFIEVYSTPERDKTEQVCLLLSHTPDHALITEAVRAGHQSLLLTGVLTQAREATRRCFPALPSRANKETRWKRSNDEVIADCLIRYLFSFIMEHNEWLCYYDVIGFRLPEDVPVAMSKIVTLKGRYAAIDRTPEEMSSHLLQYTLQRGYMKHILLTGLKNKEYHENPERFIWL